MAPSVAVSPDLGAGVGEAVEVVPAGTPGVAGIANARLATGPSASVGAPVAVSAPAEGESAPLLAVSPGRVVESPGPNPAPPAPAGPPSQPEPATQPVAAAPEPAPVVPVATTPPLVASTGSARPGSSGVIPPVGPVEPAPSCEGDEYTITVSSEPGETVSEESELEILIRHVASDGSESELLLEGDLGDVRNLVDLFVSEGNCVQVVFEPQGEGETLEPAAP